MPPPPDLPYEAIFSGVQKARVRALGAVAARRRLRRRYLAALAVILRRLATDPLQWGDPYSRLEDLGLLLYHRSYTPLNLFYAVDAPRWIVYNKDIDPLPGQGLDPAE